MEALNPILREKLRIKNDPVTCPKCGHKWVVTPTVSGIRVFIQGEMKEEVLYRKIRDIRIRIMHNTTKLQNLQELVEAYAPKTGETLFRAVCFLLGFKEWKIMAHGPVMKEFPTRGELQGMLIGGDASSLGPTGEDPHFELHHQITESSLREDGTIKYKGQTSLTPHLNPEVKFTGKEIRFYGDSETTGEITKISLVPSDGKQ